MLSVKSERRRPAEKTQVSVAHERRLVELTALDLDVSEISNHLMNYVMKKIMTVMER